MVQELGTVALPTEILLAIFAQLTPETFARCGRVCKQWYAITNDENLWKRICERKWKGKMGMPGNNGTPLTLFANADYSKVLDQLSDAELVHIIEGRRSIAATITITKRKRESTLLTPEEEHRELVRRTQPKIKGLTAQPSKWKTSYIYAEYDAKRTSITAKELLSCQWALYNKRPSPYASLEFVGTEVFATRRPPFMPEGQRFPITDWCFASSQLIQIRATPYHVMRTPDWGWRLVCLNCELHSLPLTITNARAVAS